MRFNFARRIEAIERSRSTSVPTISASEVAGIKAALWRKLSLPATSDDDIPAPISRKSVEKARGSALWKLRSFLDGVVLRQP